MTPRALGSASVPALMQSDTTLLEHVSSTVLSHRACGDTGAAGPASARCIQPAAELGSPIPKHSSAALGTPQTQ